MARTKNIRNHLEVRLFAMRRSGSHAVLNWLTSLFPGNVCFLNDVSRFTDKRPARPSYDLPALPRGRRVTLRETKNLLLYNLEDTDLREFGEWWLPSKNKGFSQTTHTLLLLRDPYNMFASRLKIRSIMPENPFAKEVMPDDRERQLRMRESWLQHAREFLRTSNYLGDAVTCVNFNEWAFNPDYRRTICDLLGGQFTEDAVNQVSRYGWGSSFEGYRDGFLKYRMGLLHRWRHFHNDPTFQFLIDDSHLHSLSQQIFGNVRE